MAPTGNRAAGGKKRARAPSTDAVSIRGNQLRHEDSLHAGAQGHSTVTDTMEVDHRSTHTADTTTSATSGHIARDTTQAAPDNNPSNNSTERMNEEKTSRSPTATHPDPPAGGPLATALSTARHAVLTRQTRLHDMLHEVATGFDRMTRDLQSEFAQEAGILTTSLSSAIRAIVTGHADRGVNAARAQGNSGKINSTPHTDTPMASYASVARRGADRQGTVRTAKRRVVKMSGPVRLHNPKDKRVMIRMEADCPARKCEEYAIRQKIRSIVSDPAAIKDIVHVKSGVAIVASSAMKATEVMQHQEQI